jgi:phosphatidylglycerophosphate synthase
MKKFLIIRNFIFKRNIKLFKNEYNWNYKLISNPYRKIKTVFNLEIAAFFLFLLDKTKIKPNQVTLFGVLWVYLGAVLISLDINYLTWAGLAIFFTKLIHDYIDGSLAHLKNQQSTDGFELDLWAGDVNKIGVIVGTIIYIYNSTLNIEYLYILLILVIFNMIDPRKHLSRTKFGVSVYKKELQTHTLKINSSKSIVVNFLKFFNYDGKTSYSDFIILLIIIDLTYQVNNVLIILPWIWLCLSLLALLRAVSIVFYNK